MSDKPFDQEYELARHGAVLFDISNQAKVELTGPEAPFFLHNLCSNDILHLAPNSGCEAFFATAKAKVVAHTFVYRLNSPDNAEAIWLDSVPGTAETVIKHLDHFRISERVEFVDRTNELGQFHLAGPQASAVLTALFDESILQLKNPGNSTAKADSGFIVQIRRHEPLGLPGYDILSPRDQAADLWRKLTATARPASLATYETLRVEAGTPIFGKDFDDSHLVMEIGRTRQAICYTKGCFIGQEPIVRSRDLGHVNRTLLGLRIRHDKPVEPGAKVFRNSNEVGYVTSSVFSPLLGTAIALAYLRRGNQDPGTELEVEAATGRVVAEAASLPFTSGTVPVA